jgi:hypothetical protein
MNVLDEQIPEDQRRLLRSWRVPVRHIGYDIGRQGIKDPEIIPFLLALRRPTLLQFRLRLLQPSILSYTVLSRLYGS